MPILSTGAALSNVISFNAGTLNVNGMELAALQDITVTISFAEKEIRALGTIKMLTAPKRHGYKVDCKAKTKSINEQLFTFLMGSSNTDGSGFDYTLFDGQNVLTRASIKAIMNENTGQHVEFQFTNAILAGNFGVAFKMEDAAEIDLEIHAQDVTVVTDF